MTMGLVFWILMLLWLVIWGINWSGYAAGPYWPHVSNLFLFMLFLLLGWATFGAPIR